MRKFMWASLFVLGCKAPDNSATIEALIEDGKTRELRQVALAIKTVEPEMPPREGVYRIGVNDVLRIHVVGHPEFSARGETSSGELVGIRVQADGKIYVPMVDGVDAEGRTTLEVQKDLRAGLSKYIKEPFVSVEVVRYESQRYHLLGSVESPGVFPVDGRTTILDAVGRGGGIRPDADLLASYVIRGKKLLPVSLYELLQRGNVTHDILLEDRDFIYIPPSSDQGRVYVLGEVDDPGPVPINPGGLLTLAEAIAAAGDIDPVMANKNHVKIFRGEWGRPQEFLLSYNDVKQFGGSIPLKRNDRIYVGPRALATWGRAWALLLPFVNNPIILAQIAGR